MTDIGAFGFEEEYSAPVQMREVVPEKIDFGIAELEDKSVKAKIVKKFEKLPFLGPELQSERIK
jgi:hypothetical protein